VTFTRRQFLVRSGWLAGGITVLGIAGCAALPPLPTFRVTAEKDIFTWVQIMKNGRIRFYLPRAELGQGISTGLSQVVAEELNVALENVDCHYQSTVLMAPCQMTVGSQSMENYFTLTARSAAFLRATLQARAASKYGLTDSQLSSARHGFVTHDGRAIQYNELVDEPQVIQLASDTGIPLFSERKAAELTSVGKSVEQVNILSVVVHFQLLA